MLVPGGGHRGGGVGRHPDGLKGREIGLWYANKNKSKKDMKAGRKEAQQEDAERKNVCKNSSNPIFFVI